MCHCVMSCQITVLTSQAFDRLKLLLCSCIIAPAHGHGYPLSGLFVSFSFCQGYSTFLTLTLKHHSSAGRLTRGCRHWSGL
ncbi:hypothetical protein EDB87DRAFT_1608452 [Lactarius vividus]|nr:hypothetical protein EDB87DRAFT_1608452 [Lactarius vividus]